MIVPFWFSKRLYPFRSTSECTNRKLSNSLIFDTLEYVSQLFSYKADVNKTFYLFKYCIQKCRLRSLSKSSIKLYHKSQYSEIVSQITVFWGHITNHTVFWGHINNNSIMRVYHKSQYSQRLSQITVFWGLIPKHILRVYTKTQYFEGL